uniref:Uncharacterized protein n=1 Tax=virus sp. ctiha2 TaxID=2827299 RepID=A0A8S5RGG5_9VIRU|nr:MAG TPA: hypothetical protein [virus sp. ctiha2]DAX97713.1 MAG TPA: hypothetical protein [Caudoviricetes sp.]
MTQFTIIKINNDSIAQYIVSDWRFGKTMKTYAWLFEKLLVEQYTRISGNTNVECIYLHSCMRYEQYNPCL